MLVLESVDRREVGALGDEDVEVENVTFENGLLTIDLQKHIPEQQKHKLWFGKELKKLDASAS